MAVSMTERNMCTSFGITVGTPASNERLEEASDDLHKVLTIKLSSSRPMPRQNIIQKH
jgi:hypothetical protein